MRIGTGPSIAVALTLALAGIHAAAPAHGRDPDPENGSRAEQRLDKANRDIADRAAKRDADYATQRARIEADMAKDPEKAATDLQKLDADFAKETDKLTQDTAKAQEDFAEESAKEAEDLAERGIDDSGRGNPESLRDLGQSEGAEFDSRGFPVKRGEVVGIDLSPATVAKAEARGFKVVSREKFETLDREVVRLSAPHGMNSESALRELREIDPTAVVDMIHYYGLDIAAGGAGHQVKAKAMPSVSSQPATIGVIDTALASHPALRRASVVTWQKGMLAGAPMAHGTAVASLLASEGQVRLYSANIFRGTAERPFTSAEVIADALEWMLKAGVPTINMSLAGPRNAILDQLIRDALARGRTVVAAAGNGGPAAPPAYPAAVPGVVAVTAVDKDFRIYRYANRGRYITIAARGVDVLAARAPGGYARFTGTSFATPHIAGWVARCRSSGQSARNCEARLRKSARDLGTSGYDEVFGFGVVE